MAIPEYSPSLVGIYFHSASLLFLNQKLKENPGFALDLQKYFRLFSEKINTIFPRLPIYSNWESLNKILEGSGISSEYLSHTDEVDFLKSLLPKLPIARSEIPEWDEVCFLYFSGIAPLLDTQLTEKIWSRHKQFLSQYSYSENLPDGIVPKILTREFLLTIPEKVPGSVHDFFLKNINQYDIEIFFQKPDLRQMRLNLIANNPRSIDLIQNLIDLDSNLPYEKLEKTLRANPQWFRSGPSYIEIEIYRGCQSKCTFCPRQHGFVSEEIVQIDPQILTKIANEMKSFPTNYTACFGGLGEPLLHPNWTGMAKIILPSTQVEELIVETALTIEPDLLTRNLKEFSTDELEKIGWIINLTTWKQDRYKSMYGKDEFAKVKENIRVLTEMVPKKNISIQLIKMLEVEDEVESYFNTVEGMGLNVVFQKYNTFAHRMPEKRVSDLTPLQREFCWHLARDLYINADGDVSICRQVPNQKLSSDSNIGQKSLKEIWSEGQKSFSASFLGNHQGTGAPCLQCDEWYTFNA
jgi:spiro-SPASM protein